MELKTVLGGLAIVVLLFFGVIFALASVYATTRLIVAALLFVVAFAIGFYITRKPKTIIQKVEFSGEMKAVSIKCPNCAGSLDSNSIKIKDGVPYATCPYCGHTFEVTEEPKW
jgi:Zn finger protein HypA/HybF involved in hydrogenase expression